jgi:hypothetical protein
MAALAQQASASAPERPAGQSVATKTAHQRQSLLSLVGSRAPNVRLRPAPNGGPLQILATEKNYEK